MNVLLSHYDEFEGTVVLNGAIGPVDDMIHVAQVMTWENEQKYERQRAANGPTVRAFNDSMRAEIYNKAQEEIS